MSIRLWYPQLDIYDCIRRMGMLLRSWPDNPPSLERLYITDFFLANPPLLHDTSMTQDIRKVFSGLEIPKPAKAFISYPSSQLLFHKMEPIQKHALQTIVGKGLIDDVKLKNGLVEKTVLGEKAFNQLDEFSKNSQEKAIVTFLNTHYAHMSLNDLTEFRRKTGLRRAT